MINTKVSVILTSYNRDKLLKDAIESVLNQTFKDYHLFIMDDESENPKTHEILDSYNNNPKISIYREKLNGIDRYSRCGYGININKALSLTQSPYITYLTCDDIYYPTRLMRFVNYLNKHPQVYIVFGRQRVVKLNDDDFTISIIHTRKTDNILAKAACLVDHNSIMHRIECLSMVGGLPLWPERKGHLGSGDAYVWKKFNKVNLNFYLLDDNDQPTDEHRNHKKSIQHLS